MSIQIYIYMHYLAILNYVCFCKVFVYFSVPSFPETLLSNSLCWSNFYNIFTYVFLIFKGTEDARGAILESLGFIRGPQKLCSIKLGMVWCCKNGETTISLSATSKKASSSYTSEKTTHGLLYGLCN